MRLQEPIRPQGGRPVQAEENRSSFHSSGPLGIDHLGNREALYRRTAEISPPGRSSRCGGVLIGRP